MRAEILAGRDLTIEPRVDAQFRKSRGDRRDERALFPLVGNEDFRHIIALEACSALDPRLVARPVFAYAARPYRLMCFADGIKW